MGNRSEPGVLRVTLHTDPESLGELDVLQQYVYVASGRNVILDFASVEVFRSQMVIGLLVLDTLLREAGRTLTLCSVSPSIRAVFEQLGLENLFSMDPPCPPEDAIPSRARCCGTESGGRDPEAAEAPSE